MSHRFQRKYCRRVKEKFPQYFIHVNVLDIGSLDVNGNNRYLFENSYYTGIDICSGKNVDIVCPAYKFRSDDLFDTIISTECWEHDEHYNESILNALSLLKSNGLFLFTCATTGRPEHGTFQSDPMASPITNNYYKNLTEKDFREILDFDKVFKEYEFNVFRNVDIRFWGIKN